MATPTAVIAEGDTALAELDYQEMIVPVELDEDLEAWMQAVPTYCCCSYGCAISSPIAPSYSVPAGNS